MNAIDEYLAAKSKLQRFNSWASLIGKEYFGGTRGKGGAYGEITSASLGFTIYHQAYDGATNYHNLEAEFASESEFAAMALWPQLINKIREKLEEKLELAAIEARKLAAELAPKENP